MAALAAATAMTATGPPAHAANASLCNIWCDGRDPGFAAVDRQAATASQWSRAIVLHIDDPDDMAWASIGNGSPADEVWMDRSTDGGQTWSGGSKLGDTTIPAGRTDWRTMMFNVDGAATSPSDVIRACGKAGDRPEIACTVWTRTPATPQNVYTEPRDPGVAAGDRTAATATQWSRNIAIHLDDPDDMAWATIANGSPADEVWMDRSWDGGQTWSGGSKLGDTTIPAGRTDWRTVMFNVDYPMVQEVGAIRACGRAGGRPEIACTPWVRSTAHAADSRSAAVTALAQFWSPRSGNWSGNVAGGRPSGADGWQDANALTSLVDYLQRSGDSSYAYIIPQVYFHNIQNNYQQTLPNFTDQYLDDAGWWGLAWLRAYGYTHNAAYLQIAEADSDYMSGYWNGSPGACTGGVWWSTAKQNMNAIENELYLELNAALHNHVSGDTTYLARARQEWSWFRVSGLIDNGVVADGLALTRDGSGNIASCPSNSQQGWTYNQGVILDGLAQLSIATGDKTVLTTANAIASSAVSRLSTNGVLTEPGTGTPDCLTTTNGVVSTLDWDTFKGVFMRNLYEFAKDTNTSAYNTFLAAQLPSIASKDSNADAQAGYTWTGPIQKVSYACQESALDAANATF